MQRRFESDPLFQATLLLLQERIPQGRGALSRIPPSSPRSARSPAARRRRCASSTSPDTPMPGSAAAVERPLPRDGHQRGRRQPAGRTSPSRAGARTPPATTGARSATSATWRAASSGRPRTSRRCKRADALRGDLHRRRAPSSAAATTTSRRIPRSSSRRRTTSSCAALRITNRSRARRTIEVTSYAEVVLAPAAADALHPAFSNLFVQTEIVARARRRSCARAGRARSTSRRRGCST